MDRGRLSSDGSINLIAVLDFFYLQQLQEESTDALDRVERSRQAGGAGKMQTV